MALAQPEFDSITTVVSTPLFQTLPSVGNNAAVLMQDGEVVKIFANSNAIASQLRTQLSK